MLLKIILLSIIGILALIISLILYSYFVSFRVPKWLKKNVSNSSPLFSDGKAQIGAHRAGAGLAPENTPMAFDICVHNKKINITELEFDLHITKEGELIIFHDKYLDRTTNSKEKFKKRNIMPSELSYYEIKQLNPGESFVADDGSTPFAGLRGTEIPNSLYIPKLEEIIDSVEAKGKYLYSIDIKDNKKAGKYAADKLIELCKNKGISDRVIIASFHNNITAYLTKNHKNVQRSAGVLECVVFYFCCALNIHFQKHLPFNAVQIFSNKFLLRCGSERFVRYCHYHRVAVQYWTIDDPKKIAYLNSIGADCIITNVPDKMYNILYNKQHPL